MPKFLAEITDTTETSSGVFQKKTEKCWCFVLTADNHNLSLPHALKELNNLAQGLGPGVNVIPPVHSPL